MSERTRGVTVWFTGLSGVGKTTLSRRLEERLRSYGYAVERLDGDVVRQGLTRDLGFSKEDRDRNIERVTFVAKLLTRNGVIVLAAFISPYRAMREYARKEIGHFLEVYLTAPIEVLIRRDTKGLYRKALAGELKGFTGVDDPYEPPLSPDLTLRTDRLSVDECAEAVLAVLEERGYIEMPRWPSVRVSAEPVTATEHAAEAPGPELWPIPPHGGILVDRLVPQERRAEELARSRELPAVVLDAQELADVEMIGTGAMSPLTGFMGRKDYETVLENMRLSDGLVWSLPVTLTVDADVARSIREGEEVALRDLAGRIVALMRVEEKFESDPAREARQVFGTEDPAHPGVARLLGKGEVKLGGPVWLLRRPFRDRFASYRLTPRETRRIFRERGWRTVAAFQTRNPLHRAHEYLQKVALEMVHGLLLHPLVGATKADDVPADVRLRTYEEALARYYPPSRVLLAVYPAAMRYAGPREAIFHAITRKNYGCTHMIVGRDHAGVGNYYGPYDAQAIFDRFRPEELGIVPLKFEQAFYCRACSGMATAKTCPHGAEEHVILSGTRVREMLRAGMMLPPEFTRPEVARILLESYQSAEERPKGEDKLRAGQRHGAGA